MLGVKTCHVKRRKATPCQVKQNVQRSTTKPLVILTIKAAIITDFNTQFPSLTNSCRKEVSYLQETRVNKKISSFDEYPIIIMEDATQFSMKVSHTHTQSQYETRSKTILSVIIRMTLFTRMWGSDVTCKLQHCWKLTMLEEHNHTVGDLLLD